MPQLLPLCTAERVAEEMRSLHNEVSSCLDAIDKRLPRFPSDSSAVGKSRACTNVGASTGVGAVASAVGSSQKFSADPLECRSNVILFGVSEDKDLAVVSDVLKAAAGAPVPIKDMFRLGKKPQQSQFSGLQSSDLAILLMNLHHLMAL